jgi:hypothetical protein
MLLLCHTAAHTDYSFGILLFKMLQFAQRSEYFIFSIFSDGAGIEYYKLSLRLFIGEAKANICKLTFQLFTVTDILLAAE